MVKQRKDLRCDHAVVTIAILLSLMTVLICAYNIFLLITHQTDYVTVLVNKTVDQRLSSLKRLEAVTNSNRLKVNKVQYNNNSGGGGGGADNVVDDFDNDYDIYRDYDGKYDKQTSGSGDGNRDNDDYHYIHDDNDRYSDDRNSYDNDRNNGNNDVTRTYTKNYMLLRKRRFIRGNLIFFSC
ncbi:hypothetical protein DOLIC_00094 [Dolichomitus sp. PSUC_FEM 10030005]|nr:hypothetical protein [Dolichomitus sp. PSUC_FEM 10030005]